MRGKLGYRYFLSAQHVHLEYIISFNSAEVSHVGPCHFDIRLDGLRHVQEPRAFNFIVAVLNLCIKSLRCYVQRVAKFIHINHYHRFSARVLVDHCLKKWTPLSFMYSLGVLQHLRNIVIINFN